MNTTLLKQEQDRMQKEIDLLKELMSFVNWGAQDLSPHGMVRIPMLMARLLQEKTK